MANTTGKKFGGRKKGTPNKVTQDLRQWITDFLEGNREQVIQDLQAVEPKERLQFYEKLLQYAVPKMRRTEIEGQLNVPIEQVTGMKIK